jgi:hypothetical protein
MPWPPETREQLSERMRETVRVRWDRTEDRVAATESLRAGLTRKFWNEVDQIDPEHRLPEAERQQLFVQARKAHYARCVWKRKATLARKRAEAAAEASTTPDTTDTETALTGTHVGGVAS